MLLISAMEERMISDFSKKVKFLYSLMSLYLPIPVIRGLKKFTKIAEFRLKGKKIVVSAKRKRRRTENSQNSGYWLNTYSEK